MPGTRRADEVWCLRRASPADYIVVEANAGDKRNRWLFFRRSYPAILIRYVGNVMGVLMTHDFPAAPGDTSFTQQDTSRG